MKSFIFLQSLGYGATVLANLSPVQFKAPTPSHFAELVANDTIDFGCRPIAKPTSDDNFSLHALLTESQIVHFESEYALHPSISIHREKVKRQSTRAPIGTGDRFSSGTIVPKGLGQQAAGTTIPSIMNVNEINSAIQAIARTYGASTLTLPYRTFNGATQTVLYVGAGTDKSRYHLYLSAAMHARERGGPDNLLYWLSDLLAANRTGTGLTYGSKTYTIAQIRSVLSAGIVAFPLVNPDGVAYDQATNSLWRKNRNTRSGTSGSSVGVDLNRNFDFLWNFKKHFSSSANPASTSPSSETFYGTGPASEPETKNHVSVYDSFPKIRWFMDIHSAAADVLYSWGDDENQATSSSMNFLNAAYDGRRGIIGDTTYKEYIPSADATNSRNVATKMAAGMRAVGGRSYTAMQSVGLYATSGASDDYAFSRYWALGKNKVYGATLEFGKSSGNFYPTVTEFNQNLLDTGAGFMEWALAAIAVGLN